MIITKQDGEIVMAHTVEMTGCSITCILDKDVDKKIECGTYENTQRTMEVFAEMTCIGWNNKNPEYVMPQD